MTTALTEKLYNTISPHLQKEISALLDRVSSGGGFFKLPTEADVMKSPIEVSRQIALSSNAYADAVRIASMARASYKLAEARYKFKFRTSLGEGKNAAEREAAAAQASEQEYDSMMFLAGIVELAESIESSCRIASESARRMLLSAQQSKFASDGYDDHSGSLNKNDYQQAF